MSLRLSLVTTLAALCLGLGLAQTTVVDDLGREVTLDAAPTRIVSLLPSHTETVCALGACDLIVGLDRHSNVAAAPEVPRLGDPFAPDVEGIVALEPDLVLLDEYSGLHQALESLGLVVFAGSPQTVAETYAYFEQMGALLGREDEAAALAASVADELAAVAARLADAARPTVFVEIDPTPFTAGPGSYVDDLLRAAGGENVVPAELGAFPQVDPEFVVAQDPQVILLLDAPFGVTARDVAARPGWSGLAAVRDGRVVELTVEQADALSRAGPRLGEAVRLLAAILHPELF